MMTRGTPWIAKAARWSWILLLPLSPGPIQGHAADSVRPLTFAEARALLLDRSPELEVQRARVDQSRALSRPRNPRPTFLLRSGVTFQALGRTPFVPVAMESESGLLDRAAGRTFPLGGTP